MAYSHLRSAWIVAALLSCSCIPQPPSLRMSLVWTPKDDVRDIAGSALDAFSRQRVLVAPFVDRRTNPEQIGTNIEQRERPVYSGDDLAAFLTKSFCSVLTENGIPVTRSGGSRVISADILRFFVTEENTYNALVTIRFRVADDTGTVLWEGTTDGHAKRWGRSFSAENYAEAYSNAFLESTLELFKTPGFLRAFY